MKIASAFFLLSLATTGALAGCSDDSSTTAAGPTDEASTTPIDDGGVDAADPRGTDPDASKADASKPDASKPDAAPGPVLPLVVNAQLSAPGTGTIGGVASAGFRIFLSDRGPLCVAGDYANAISLSIDVLSTSIPLATGTYPVTSPGTPALSVGARYSVQDATCKADQARFHFATSGKIVITAISAAGVKGTYDLTFENNSHLAGAFDTENCDVTTITGPKVCRP